MSDTTAATLVPPTWPMMMFYGMSIVSLPLYLVVFVCLLRLRYVSKTYNSTFYSILLQHCIADLLAMLIFFVTNPMRTIPLIREFFFNYQSFYIAAASYNSIYYFLYIRCTGIIFLSLQRYFVICCPMLQFTYKIQNASKLTIVVIYWIVPTVISAVVLKDTDFSYDSFERMAIIADQDVIQRNTLMALVVVGLTCILCSLAYGALFYYIRKHTAGLSRSLRRELHLAFQVFVLLLAFFAILVYYAFQNYFSQTHNTGPIFYMRALYPVANGLLSYINPFCILFLNRDLARQVIKTIKCSKYQVSDAQVSGNVTTSTKRASKKGIDLLRRSSEEPTPQVLIL
ncbi:G-protein coupled receptors family 1 profile domain-containing protein [Caenorhabditis elegans]|uniref:G-protein coupled receptors family 1 profile domain-containing protein n=1 Tax=Caenorhabditis elegans TaxID=6239 RepID=Q22451_CAEEL|nr:G-protein coupled receptors family 1 profile domain-containing protein [Caenorhabditis elegans]CCD72066.1 G-protein coupled receptors family 1 profile domain-containing protein [Caenorhabditis elegans]|eukprot:NP_500956.1 OPSin related [Caenorhabditis elegans]